MKIKLTPYNDDNQIYIWQVYIESMQAHIEKIWGWDIIWQKQDFAKALDKFSTDLILFDGVQIGYVQYLQASDYIYINMLILEPFYQSQGYGPKILEKIGSIKSGLSIELRCFRVNLKALNFYLENGFEIINKDNEFFMLKKNHLSKNKA